MLDGIIDGRSCDGVQKMKFKASRFGIKKQTSSETSFFADASLFTKSKQKLCANSMLENCYKALSIFCEPAQFQKRAAWLVIYVYETLCLVVSNRIMKKILRSMAKSRIFP